jgi:hypothetical protein
MNTRRKYLAACFILVTVTLAAAVDCPAKAIQLIKAIGITPQ